LASKYTWDINQIKALTFYQQIEMVRLEEGESTEEFASYQEYQQWKQANVFG